MDLSESEVSFYSDGGLIHGTLCAPSRGAPWPAVILIHGFGSFRDELTGFVQLAQRMARKGLVSLRIDMRGCGRSGIRGVMHPAWDWVEDLRQAVSFLQTLPTIMADRIGVVGMSMGGGVACIAAGIDERLRVIVALAPVVDGQDWFRHLWTTNRGEEAWHRFHEQVLADRKSQALRKRSTSISVLDAMAYAPADRDAYRQIVKKYPAFLRRIRLSSVDSALRVRAAPFAPLIAPRPLLIIHSRADTSVPIRHAEMLAGAAGKPHRLIRLEHSPHCFWIGNQSVIVQEETAAWLQQCL